MKKLHTATYSYTMDLFLFICRFYVTGVVTAIALYWTVVFLVTVRYNLEGLAVKFPPDLIDRGFRYGLFSWRYILMSIFRCVKLWLQY